MNMNMNRIKKIGRVAVMIMSLIAVPVMLALMMSSSRAYGLYDGHAYEVDYWWQVIVLLGACNCICSRATRKRRDSDEISKNAALISIIVVTIVVMLKSSWGLVKILDTVGGGNAGGVFLIWIPPFLAMLLCYFYYAIGRFVADK